MTRVSKRLALTWLTCALILTTSIFISGCNKGYKDYFSDENTKGGFIYDKLKSFPEFTSFTSALEKANIVQFLSQGGLYTVFAPTNEAFSEFLKNQGYATVDAVPQDKLYDILSYHIVSNMWYYYDFQVRYNSFRQELFLTRNKKFVDVDVKSGFIKVNGINTIATLSNIDADNGVIHGVEHVLVPLPNLEQTFVGDSELKNSTFYKLMQVVADSAYDRFNSFDKNRDGIFDSVFYKTYSVLNNVSFTREFRDNTTPSSQGGDPLFTTVLVPSNRVLDTLLAPALNQVGNDISKLSPSYAEAILESYFISDSLVTAEQLVSRPKVLKSVNNEEIPPLGPHLFLRQDIRASNGLIHMIDTLLGPSSALRSALGQLLGNPNYSMFFAAIQKAGQTNAWLNANKTGTFFAVNNQAFIDAQLDVKEQTLGGAILTNTQFSNIVRYHLINENLTQANLSGGANVTKNSDLGSAQQIVFKTENGLTTITTASGQTVNITFPEISKGLGIPPVGYVYAIDKLMLPKQ